MRLVHIWSGLMCYLIIFSIIPPVQGEIDLSDEINILLEDLGITLSKDDSQEFIMSDNNATHYTMETTKLEQRKWQGLVYRDKNYITNIWFTDGQEKLDETSIVSTEVYPDRVVYNYDNGGKEELFVPDDRAALVIEYTGIANQIRITPTYAMRTDYYSSSGISQYSVISDPDGTIYIKAVDTDYIALVASINGTYKDIRQLKGRYFSRDHLRNDGSGYENVFAPGHITYASSSIKLVAAIGSTMEGAKKKARDILNNLEALKQQKRRRLQNISDSLNYSATMRYGDGSIDLGKSFRLAMLSLDKLKMKRFGTGTYAGLHWFDDYWGRDTFISFYGSSLVQGDWEFARQTIETMAKLQLNNSNLYEFGRVPNRVSVEDSTPDYTTADGTGWFVKAIGDYIKYTADIDFAKKMYPHLKLAVDGESSRLDGNGFVTHEARGTWMDAYTSGVVQTPRDASAVEIQGLLYQIYENTIMVGSMLGDIKYVSDLVIKRDMLLSNIREYYYDNQTGLLADHLNSDGSRDTQLRPNQFLTLGLLPDNFLNSTDLNRLINASEALITSYGVRTLDPGDPDYKATHDGGWWNHDVAYHNGDVWPWLSGATIDLLFNSDRLDLLIDLIYNLNIHTLTKNPVGGIGEVFDGTSTGDAESVGALLQLWSMAEYIRVLTQVSHGFEINNNTMSINARGLRIFDTYSTNIAYRDQMISYSAINDEYGYIISLDNIPEMVNKLVLEVPAIVNPIISEDVEYSQEGDKLVLLLNVAEPGITLTIDERARPVITSDTLSTEKLPTTILETTETVATGSIMAVIAVFINKMKKRRKR